MYVMYRVLRPSLSLATATVLALLASSALAGDGLSVGSLVRADGTLDLDRIRATGYQGPLDLSGFDVQADPASGAPVFAQAGEATESGPGGVFSPILTGSFSSGFNCPGTGPAYFPVAFSNFTESAVWAATIYQGSLVLGGNFKSVGATPALRVASWDGASWSALGSGVGTASGTEVVYALTVYDGKLIAGGTFATAGGTSAKSVAQWNGVAWSNLGKGTNGSVYALAAYGTQLAAGGSFTTADDLAANNIASWDAAGWASFGGANGSVNALLVDGETLYAGGDFTWMGTGAAYRLAKFAAGTWSEVGIGLNGPVNALAIKNGIVAGGDFTATSDGATSLQHVARFDGSAWTAMGSGVDGSVTSLLVRTEGGVTYVYAGGLFNSSGGTPMKSLAKWNNSQWIVPSTDTPDAMIWTLTEFGGSLVAGGGFHYIGALVATSCATLNGSTWSAMATGLGLGGKGLAFCIYGGDLVVGGNYFSAGVTIAGIASWNGASWTAIGDNLIGSVSCLAVYNGELYAGGSFMVGEPSLTGILRWNGATWSEVGSGGAVDAPAGGVNCMVVYNAGAGDRLYVGGSFTQNMSGLPISNVCMLFGATWANVGTGVGGGIPFAMAAYGGNLVVGGSFATAGGVSIKYLAKWNGSSWSKFNTQQANQAIYTLQLDGSNLYVGGRFTAIGGVSMSRIARWNGSSWSALGSGVTGDVLDIELYGTDVVATGAFTGASGSTVNQIARWNGSSWAGVSSGLGGSILGGSTVGNALAVYGNDLYVGGNFSTAGGLVSSGFARYSGTLLTAPSRDQLSEFAGHNVGAVPTLTVTNPLRAGNTLRLSVPRAGAVSIRIYDVQGRQARELDLGNVSAGAHEVAWDGRDSRGAELRSGVYFLRVTTPGQSTSRRVTVIH